MVSIQPNEDLKSAGFQIDGWANLLRGRADLEDKVKTHFTEDLKASNIPDIDIWELNAKGQIITSRRRQYYAVLTKPSFTITTYIGARGKDLYVTWRAYLKLRLNWKLIFILLAVSIGLGQLFGWGALLGSNRLFQGLINSFAVGLFCSGFLFFPLAFCVAVYSQLVFKDPFSAFLLQPSVFEEEDFVATAMAVHQSLVQAFRAEGISEDLIRHKEQFSAGKREFRI